MARKKRTDELPRSLLDDAWDRVRTRAGSSGSDGVDMATFEADHTTIAPPPPRICQRAVSKAILCE